MPLKDEPPYLTDDEVREICAGLVQPAAMIRYLRDEIGLRAVKRKPNGYPLVGRVAFEVAMGAPVPREARQVAGGATAPNREALMALNAKSKARRS